MEGGSYEDFSACVVRNCALLRSHCVVPFLALTRQVSCEDIVVREIPSNDGALKVSRFKRECIGEPVEGGVSVMERAKFGVQGAGNLLRIAGGNLEGISVRSEKPRTLVIGIQPSFDFAQDP